MAHFRFVTEVEQLGIDLVAGQCGDRERGDEFLSAFCHDATTGNVAAPQLPDQFQAFIGGNATGNDQKDAFLRHGRSSIR